MTEENNKSRCRWCNLANPLYVRHPSEIVSVGDVVKVTVLEVDEKKRRISLSMKQASKQ